MVDVNEILQDMSNEVYEWVKHNKKHKELKQGQAAKWYKSDKAIYAVEKPVVVRFSMDDYTLYGREYVLRLVEEKEKELIEEEKKRVDYCFLDILLGRKIGTTSRGPWTIHLKDREITMFTYLSATYLKRGWM